MMDLKNKTVLVTGGTGSFGSKFVDALLKTNVKKIVVFSRDEKKQEDMRLSLSDDRMNFIIGDVRDYNSLKYAFLSVDYVFHAAALKQVPSCEFFPMEAVKTNILGAENIMNASSEYGIKKCILLSTDKAVSPVNAMGLTKAVMERVMLSKARTSQGNRTIFSAKRYGNVVGSRGSVIPLFLKQIKESSPITLTNIAMTRFMMTLEDAVDLVFYALENAQQGDIFVQKSSAASLKDIVCALEQYKDKTIEKTIIGTRHGEKLYEDLVSGEELLRSEENENFYIIKMDNRNLNYTNYLNEGIKIENIVDSYNSHNSTRLTIDEIITLLKKTEISND